MWGLVYIFEGALGCRKKRAGATAASRLETIGVLRCIVSENWIAVTPTADIRRHTALIIGSQFQRPKVLKFFNSVNSFRYYNCFIN